jgi:predicted transcriptional regulator
MKNRSRLEVIASILEVTKNPLATSTKIIYNSFISHGMLQEYLPFILEKGLIQVKEEKGKYPSSRSYILTDKGRCFLEIYDKLSEMISRKTKQEKEEERM